MGKVDEVKKLLKEGKLSHEEIVKQTGAAMGTVAVQYSFMKRDEAKANEQKTD